MTCAFCSRICCSVSTMHANTRYTSFNPSPAPPCAHPARLELQAVKPIIIPTVIASILSLTAVSAAQARDCSGFTNRAAFFTSIGFSGEAAFWTSVANECEASNWAAEDRSTVRANVQTLAEENSYERPDRETLRAAAISAGVELPSRRGKGKKGKNSRGGN